MAPKKTPSGAGRDPVHARNDHDFHRGTFRVRGDVIEVFPASEDEIAIRIELFGDEVERISMVTLAWYPQGRFGTGGHLPSLHYVTPKEQMDRALQCIEEEAQGLSV